MTELILLHKLTRNIIIVSIRDDDACRHCMVRGLGTVAAQNMIQCVINFVSSLLSLIHSVALFGCVQSTTVQPLQEEQLSSLNH